MTCPSFAAKLRRLLKGKATERKNIGDRGEKLAAKMLKSQGLKIIEKNYSRPFGEIA